MDRRVTLDDVRAQLNEFSEVWDQLFPLEQHRIIQLLIKRIVIEPNRLNITFQPNGIVEVYEQISGNHRAS